MINLIPPEGHKAVKREYILRVGATLAFLFGWVAIFLGIALVPTYVLIDAQIDTFVLEEATEEVKEESFKKAQEEVHTIETVLTQLKTDTSKVLPSVVIAEIQKQSPSNVTFRQFSIDEVGGIIEKVQIQGIAPTRESLARLKNVLEASEMFNTAEVPLADLARDVELPFAITVTMSPNVTP